MISILLTSTLNHVVELADFDVSTVAPSIMFAVCTPLTSAMLITSQIGSRIGLSKCGNYFNSVEGTC